MQTFVPFPDDAASARALDRRRLHKQVVECLQIARVLANPEARAWRNHPAVRMWRGHEARLRRYAEAMHAEWTGRGFPRMAVAFPEPPPGTDADPPWWGGPIHASHRASLFRRAPGLYGPLGWGDDGAELFWPVPLLGAAAAASGTPDPGRNTP